MKPGLPLPDDVKRKRGANGRDYFYVNFDGQLVRIHASPDTPEWPAALRDARRRKPVKKTPRSALLPALIRDFEESPEYERAAPSTKKIRRIALRRIEDWFLEYHIVHFNDHAIRRDIYAFRNSMTKTPRMAEVCIQTLCLLLNWAYDQGAEITVNHALRIKRLDSKVHPRSQIVWNDDQRLRFWTESEPAIAIAHKALFYSGARVGDVTQWQPSNYDGQWLAFVPQKTAKLGIEVHLPAYIIPPFKALLDTGLPFLTKSGKPWRPNYLIQRLIEERHRIFGRELDLHSHDLRGTLATKLADASCPDREIQAVIGHTTRDRGMTLPAYIRRTRQQTLNAYTRWWAYEFAPKGTVVELPRRG